MRSIWLVLVCVCLWGGGKTMADPSVDVSNAPSQTSVQDNDNPLASKKAKPAHVASSSSPVDQDAVDLLTSPGSEAAKAFGGEPSPTAADPTADSSVTPDMVNGNDTNPNPLGVPIRRAQKAPDSGAPPTPQTTEPDGQLPQKDEATPPGMDSGPDATAQTAQVETAPSIQPAPSLAMKLRLNDLVSLQKAAEAAGGTLNISVSVVGINPEDLIQPLRKQGIFNVSFDKNSFLVSSKNDQLGQIDALTTKRRQLLEQISDLESELASLNQKKDAPAQSTSTASTNTDTLPAASPTATSPSPDTSSGKPAELILSTNNR